MANFLNSYNPFWFCNSTSSQKSNTDVYIQNAKLCPERAIGATTPTEIFTVKKPRKNPQFVFFPNQHQTILLVQVFTFCIVFLVLHMAKNTTNHRCLILHVYISKTKPAGKTTLLESISKSAIVHNAESLHPRNKLWGYTAPRTGRSFITAGRVQPILS